jgi:hypothetical protein
MGLVAWGLLPLEGFKKALQTQVVVPRLGKAFVLLVKLNKVHVVAAYDVATPLFDGNVIVAPVLCEAPDYVE